MHCDHIDRSIVGRASRVAMLIALAFRQGNNPITQRTACQRPTRSLHTHMPEFPILAYINTVPNVSLIPR